MLYEINMHRKNQSSILVIHFPTFRFCILYTDGRTHYLLEKMHITCFLRFFLWVLMLLQSNKQCPVGLEPPEDNSPRILHYLLLLLFIIFARTSYRNKESFFSTWFGLSLETCTQHTCLTLVNVQVQWDHGGRFKRRYNQYYSSSGDKIIWTIFMVARGFSTSFIVLMLIFWRS